MPVAFSGRTPQAALAVLAVIAAPVLVGQATAPKPPAAAPPKPEAVKLSATLNGDEKDSNGQARLLLHAKDPQPTEVTVLSSDDGQTVVKAHPAARIVCNGLDARQATTEDGGQDWCLRLEDFNDGNEVAGTLSGTGVELTLSRRNPYLGWPFLVALAGLALGAAVVLVPRWLRDRIRKATLDQTLTDNEAATEARKVVCLTDWVADRRAAGDSDDALLPIVAGTIRRAPTIAARARSDLAATANRLRELLAGHRALKAADLESRRTDHKRSEFIDEDGEKVPHPAKARAALLETLAGAKRAIDLAETAIPALPTEDSKKAARQALDQARGAYTVADLPTEVPALEYAVANLERVVASAQAGAIELATDRALEVTAAPSLETRDDGTRDDVTAAKAATPTPAVAATSIRTLVLLTIVLAFGIAAWALASLWLTVYDPKDAFGGVDYATLFIGAVGSGAAAAILTLVAAWDPLSPSETD